MDKKSYFNEIVEILEKNEKARNSDLILCTIFYLKKYNTTDLKDLVNHKLSTGEKCIAISSIIRLRRKAQELFPHLNSSKLIEKKRKNREEKFKNQYKLGGYEI